MRLWGYALGACQMGSLNALPEACGMKPWNARPEQAE
jgi:hypothetical protein